jgi:RNA polymerase sigma-70 factor (ECF subfamily)
MIYDKWNKKIFLYLMTILNYNKEDANQILSDVFMALYEFNKINEVTNCKQFLYATAHNKAVDWIKKKSEDYNQEMLKDNAIDNKDIENKNNLNLTFKQKLMQKYLNMLNSEEKDVVHLYYYEDKSYEEIAQIIGSNKNTV